MGCPLDVDDYIEIYEPADLDAVVVAIPHDLHEDAVIQVTREGLPILCEKPIARTIAEADRMIDAVNECGVPLIVAESARYEPWVRRVEEYLADGAIGHPVFTLYN